MSNAATPRPVIVQPHDPAWAANFDKLAARLVPAISDFDARIEHVGSTSVPGLAAKPTIDITIVIQHEADRQPIIDALVAMNYAHLGDLGIEGREALRYPLHPIPHNLYVGLESSPAIRNHLAVRDSLHADPDLVAEYAALKLRLSNLFSNDIDAYTEAKSAFLASILQQAGFSDAELAAIKEQNMADPNRT